jgi:hypothetical protein
MPIYFLWSPFEVEASSSLISHKLWLRQNTEQGVSAQHLPFSNLLAVSYLSCLGFTYQTHFTSFVSYEVHPV